MSFVGINGKAIQKAVKIIDEITDEGNLNKYKITLAEFNAFYYGIQKLYKNGTTETIMENVKNLYERCGFDAKPCVIGWKINGLL